MKEDLAPLTTFIRAGVVILLLWGLGVQSPGGCVAIRWLVFVAVVYCGFVAYGAQRHAWTVLFGMAAVVFSPLLPATIWRETWILLCISGSALCLVSILVDPVF